jgi:molecular chaperone GrpE
MTDQTPHEAAAEESAAAAPSAPPAEASDRPASAEEAQAAATGALDDLTMPPPEAVAGEEVESAEEMLDEASTPAEPDYKDLYLRASADMDNVRKRARRDVGAAEARGIGKLAKELLPAIDNLERALVAAEAAEGQGEHDITKGIRLVQSEFVGALTRAGISIEDPKGQPFDPHRHEALAQAPVEGTDAGIVVEVYQPGYMLGDVVLRAARVVVSG